MSVWTGLRKVGGQWRWSVDNTLASSGYQNWKRGELHSHAVQEKSLDLVLLFLFTLDVVPINAARTCVY